MRALAAVAAAAVVFAVAVSLPDAESARAACPYQAQVLTYNPRGWQPLLDALAANQTPCAQYYIVLPPISDKITPRGRRIVEAVRARARTSTRSPSSAGGSGPSNPARGTAKGVAFRRKMAAAGYDVRRGETWAINELPSTIRSRADTRQRARDLIRGLYTGPPGSTPSPGAVFIVGVGQAMRNFGPYKASLRGWLQDAAFWTTISPSRDLVGPGDLRQLLARLRARKRADRRALDGDQRLLAAHPEARLCGPAGYGCGARVLRPGLDSRADRVTGGTQLVTAGTRCRSTRC